jgi:hypothetical protein
MSFSIAAFPISRIIAFFSQPFQKTSAVSIHLSQGERNPIENKFSQAKTIYGKNQIKARLKGKS